MATPTLSEHTFTHSGDQQTFYWSAGPVDGPLVIFIHGWPGNGETWKPQLIALAARGFRAVAPDCRGYGRSSVPAGVPAYALEQHVADMAAHLAHLDRERAIWIGHDWGAGLVWAFAAHHPEKCVGVAGMAVPYRCIDGGMDTLISLVNREMYPEDKFPLGQWDYQAFHAEQPELSARQLDADVPATLKLMYSPGSAESFGKPAVTAFVRKAGGWWGGADKAPDTPLERSLLRHDEAAYHRMVAEFERNGFTGPNAYYLNHEANAAYGKDVPNGGVLHFPVLFIEAKWDFVCDTALSRLSEPMREYCKDLTECSIEAGHWVALEKPEETNAALIKWIETKLPSYVPSV